MGTEKVEAAQAGSQGSRMKRFWIGWSSGKALESLPFPMWRTAVNRRPFGDQGLVHSYVAVVDAGDREAAWQRVVEQVIDAEESFVREKARDFWPPAARFPKAS